jgi:hypothetical protein
MITLIDARIHIKIALKKSTTIHCNDAIYIKHTTTNHVQLHVAHFDFSTPLICKQDK